MSPRIAKKQERKLVVGLDIGTDKVLAIVAEITEEGDLELLGSGLHRSRGLKRGVIVHIESTVYAIQRAVEAAETLAGCEIHSVFTALSGSHIRSFNSHGIVAIRDGEVTPSDVERVMDAARAVAVPADQRILHILPQIYVLDQNEGVKDPVGMSGVRLEAHVHMVTGAVSAAQNAIKCVRRCGLDVDEIILSQLASSYAVLTEDEKDLGVCLVDIGAGTTDLAVFSAGAIRHTAVIPIAGEQVTNDIAVALRTPTHNAEAIKQDHGIAMASLAESGKLIEVPGVGDRPKRQLSHKALAEVIEARYEELFTLVCSELDRSGLRDMVAAGVVLTGGSANLQGSVDLAEQVFGMPVRLGLPQPVTGLTECMRDPVYATGLGLLQFAQQQYQARHANLSLSHGMRGLWTRMRGWFQSRF